MIRTISEILIEADSTNDLNVLSDCWKEIVKNKYNYPLTHIEFAEDHIRGLAKKMAWSDIQMIKNEFK